MVTKEEEKAHQEDNIYLMYDDDEKGKDILIAALVSLLAFSIVFGLFIWEVFQL